MAWSLSQRQRGVLISLFGIVWVSPDSLLVRLAEAEHTHHGCVVFYKYVFKFVATFVGMVFVIYGGPRGYVAQARAGGWHFLAAGLLEGICEATFTLATSNTSAANNLVLVSANPLWCAVLGAVLFREWPALHTCVALLLGFGCIVLVFLGSGGTSPSGRESLEGDLLGVGTGIILACYLTVIRHAGKVRPEASLVPASVLASAISVVLGFALAKGELGAECAPKSGASGWVFSAVNGMVVMPVALACFAIGPKHILSAEVGLIMLLEVLLGPLFVWLALNEMPGPWTLLGGGLLLLVLAINELLSLRAERRQAAAAKRAEAEQAESLAPGQSKDCKEANEVSAAEQAESPAPGKSEDCKEADEVSADMPDSATQPAAVAPPVGQDKVIAL